MNPEQRSGGRLRIATRASELARWQADHVGGLLREIDDRLDIEFVPVSTEGDRRTDAPLSQIGGKGVFVKEVQRAVLAGDADLAVHSAKDLPALIPEGLTLAAVPTRGEVRDALVGSTLDGLRELAASTGPTPVVATGSARRRVQLAELVPGVRFEELRGNMATRLAKSEMFDAIVVAAVALRRLDLQSRISEVIGTGEMVPQVGQGALAVECRSGDEATIARLRSIEDPIARVAVTAERAFLAELGGDCSLPAGAYCTVMGDGRLRLIGILSPSVPPAGTVAPEVTLDGTTRGEVQTSAPVVVARERAVGDDPGALGRSVARALLRRLGEC